MYKQKLKNEIETLSQSNHLYLGHVVSYKELMILVDNLDDTPTTEQAWEKIAEKFEEGPKELCATLVSALPPYNLSEKPEIPKFVADWIEHIRETNKHGDGFVGINGEDIFRIIIDMGQVSSMFPVSDLNINDYEITDELVDWCSGHETEFLRALIDGYTIEKEPAWVVRINEKLYFCRFTDKYFEKDSDAPTYIESGNPSLIKKFTNKDKAEAVAILVDGEVEEWSEKDEPVSRGNAKGCYFYSLAEEAR